jgi:hypothetical protein
LTVLEQIAGAPRPVQLDRDTPCDRTGSDLDPIEPHASVIDAAMARIAASDTGASMKVIAFAI